MRLMVTDLDIRSQIFTVVDLDSNKKVQSNPATLRNVLKTNNILNAKLNSDATGYTILNPTTNKPLYRVIIHNLVVGFRAEIINIAELERQENERRELEKLRLEKAELDAKIAKNKLISDNMNKVRAKAKVSIRDNKNNLGKTGNFKSIYYRGKMYLSIRQLLADLNPSGDSEFNNRFIELYNQGYSLDVCLGNKPASSENLRAKAMRDLQDKSCYYSTEITKYD